MAAFPSATGTDNFSYNVGMISQQDGGYGQDDDQGYNRGYNPGYLRWAILSCSMLRYRC